MLGLGELTMRYLILALLVISTGTVTAQTDSWWTYIADYDGLPGSVRLDMGVYPSTPDENYPIVVITGVQYEKHLDGLPQAKDLVGLNEVQERLVGVFEGEFEAIYVGTFTHNGEQLHYIYVSAKAEVRDSLEAFYKANCPELEFYINIKPDPSWKAYRNFLYPNKETMEFYGYKTEPTQDLSE